MSLNTIFITGSTGFVGANATAYFENLQKKTIGVSRNAQSETNTIDYGTFFQQIKNGNNAVIHLAGKAHDLKKTTETKAYFEINFELTKKIFDAFLTSESTVFIYMSSVKAVADVVEKELFETEIPAPITAYGQSKQLAEDYILKNTPSNKRVFILRPCMIHGPNNKGNLNLLYKLVSKGIPWPLGAFCNQRSFLSVENLCFVMNELIDQTQIESAAMQVADNEPLSTNQLIALLGESLDKKSTIWKIPTFLIRFLAKTGDVFHLPLNSERLQKLTENYVVSNQKLLQTLDKPLPISAKNGLKLTFRSFSKK